MIPILIALLILSVGAGLWLFLRFRRRRLRQIRFIRETLAAAEAEKGESRVIASFSTLPDRIANLGPTIRCLLEQTRPPDEIVIALPEFSVRQQEHYVIPDYLSQDSRIRILQCKRDWGPATKFIPLDSGTARGRQGSAA